MEFNWIVTIMYVLANVGITGKNNTVYTAVPVMNKSGKLLLTADCPKCKGVKTGIVFKSNNHADTYILACRKCKTYTVRKSNPKQSEPEVSAHAMLPVVVQQPVVPKQEVTSIDNNYDKECCSNTFNF